MVNMIKIKEDMKNYSKVFQQLLLTAGQFYHHSDPWSVYRLKGRIHTTHLHHLETLQTVNVSPQSLSSPHQLTVWKVLLIKSCLLT